MHYEISEVSLGDVKELVRQCELPAMREDPLQKIMFPGQAPSHHEQEEIIRWTAEGLQESLDNVNCHVRKVIEVETCSSLGFAIWTLDGGEGRTSLSNSAKRRESWNPASLNVQAWHETSARLRAEKLNVLRGQRIVWRESGMAHICAPRNFLGLNTIAVKPEDQRKGVGSLLMDWGCDRADAEGWMSFVIASPNAVQLYRNFSFELVGQVHTEYGAFTSMLRNPKSPKVKSSV